MGIGSILGTAARGVAWGQLANAALQYGPEIVKKIRERRQTHPATEYDGATIEQLQGRIEELETALARQQELTAEQARTIATLEDAARTLQARVRRATIIGAVLGLAVVTLLIVLLMRL
ncbi:hypothetical protein [Geotalea sp. SG265]|uniref:hypothetical protein n=1 Tax=Geotalea sp. SG265 TaxID=2922867 RepID=UPI001FAFAC45|nr:hypothetical protein [Geotalea sp. SG265]